jgi:predicted TIM-barrel fold metal-dependent hydrolase
VFGSDWPMADPAAEIAAIKALGLRDDAVEDILGRNFIRLLGTDTEAAADHRSQG